MLDLSNEVTIFFITCDDGTVNESHCRAALEKQTVKFRLETIRNVWPMNAAFQEMIDRCKTPYYIQVDHDMILHPDAVEKLHKQIKGAADNVCQCVLSLWDEHLRRVIVGVKIYRHDIMKQYPYRDSFSCEMNQIHRLKVDGFETAVHWPGFGAVDSWSVVGTHGAFYTPTTIYERYKRLMEKFRRYPWIGWVHVLPHEFLERFTANPTSINFYAMAGIIAGLTSDNAGEDEQSFRDEKIGGQIKRLEQMAASPGPREFSVYATAKCNLKCWFCRRTIHGPSDDVDLRPENLEKFMLLFPTLKSACIAGFGEPLMNEELPNLVRVIKKRGLFCSIITNGLLLKKRMNELRDTGVDMISVSLYGVDSENYYQTSGVKAFDLVLENIRVLTEANFCQARISHVLTRQTYRNAEGIIRIAGETGIKHIDFQNILPHKDAGVDDEEFWGSVIQEEDTEILEYFNALQNDNSEARRVERWPVPITRYGHNPHYCRSPFVSIGVNGSGHCGGCRRVVPPDNSDPHWQTDFSFIWLDRKMADLRTELSGDKPLQDRCRMCFGNWMREA